MAASSRVRLALERVLHAPLADDTQDAQDTLLLREAELLDILASGEPVHAEKQTPLEARRQVRLQMWAERGDFSAVHAADLVPEEKTELSTLEQLRALRREASPAPTAAPIQAGTIAESEFFPLRDRMLHQLEMGLFNAEQAQNLLGMLIHNARAQVAPGSDLSTVLAAQPEYFLEPQTVSLSALSKPQEDTEPESAAAAVPLHERKLLLEQKEQSLRRCADILASGAAELRKSAAPERARWSALSAIQKRGWKLTPGRPLVDMERFDMAGRRANVLDGFGTPVLQGSGALNEEGARDAWIGYGPAEAPISLLQRTLAYWAEAGDDHSARLAFPDRAWRQLRVTFQTTDGSKRWVSSARVPDADASLDAQLCDAQRDAVDSQLFHDLAAHSGTLSPVLARVVSESSITLPLSSGLELEIALVPQDAVETEAEASPHASLLLAVLRLRMLRSWTQRMDAQRRARINARPPPPRADLMAPLWRLYQYTLVRHCADAVPFAAPCGAGPCRGCACGRYVRVEAVRDAGRRADVARVAVGPCQRGRSGPGVRGHRADLPGAEPGCTARAPRTQPPAGLFPAAPDAREHRSAPSAGVGPARGAPRCGAPTIDLHLPHDLPPTSSAYDAIRPAVDCAGVRRTCRRRGQGTAQNDADRDQV